MKFKLNNILQLLIIISIMLMPFLSKGQIFQQGYPDTIFTNYFRLNEGGWTAGDATLSVPLADKRTIWLFGDSYLENVDTSNNTLPCLFQIRNCMVVQDSINPALMTTYIDEGQEGVLRTTFKLGPDDASVLWPGHGYTDSDTVYVFLDHVDNSLNNLGTFIAKLKLPQLDLIGIYPLPNFSDIQPGRAIITDSLSGYRYFYGNRLNWIVWEPYVARIPIGSNPLTSYQYYNGSGWSVNTSFAIPISSEPVSPGFSVFKMNERYYLLTQENGFLTCGLGREIYILESDNPWGPFINKTLIYTVPDQFNGHYTLTYNAQAHPSFTENNELLVSYNLNDMVDTIDPYVCPSQCRNIWFDRLDADTYRPHFIRVPFLNVNSKDIELPLLDYAFPNPVKKAQSFILKDIKEGSNVILTDLTGRNYTLVQSFNNSTVLYAPDNPGIYFLQIREQTGKIIIMKLVVIS